ncbi:type I-E CRISPR-associated protein Cse1/CasA [Verticiella sediminum]|uniref:Type I-E CRISPR-associated protein Cse1/CasA n=1 Tax=Verticiella sediminum TaxID=1247510 RepID=A0A556B1D7_9BURK|nr:type I-E CRISPR-associated protein Cse1/CasA [Verticiella sediminum]TSH99007.1 type I-E CRISPR-associated protein Cse1/CasA [Verticiella sediminum]
MNLITSSWIPVVRKNGTASLMSALEITRPEHLDIAAPRPDFQGAIYQLLIGVLQLAFAPEDVEEWREYLKDPPDAQALAQRLGPWLSAFELEGDAAAFMQDMALPADANHLSVLDLLIDAGSESNRFFNKPSDEPGFCESCAAQALFTLQINAPSGGRGVRTSLRGGGPMTTLLLPRDEDASLWQRLWLNVMPAPALAYPPVEKPGSVLPWLVPTRTSDGAQARETLPQLGVPSPDTVHPLQAYWSMPRRIRLDAATACEGQCAICGADGVRLFRHYRTRHGGTNYTGPWVHPLTPYSLDPKGESPPLSVKGQPGGIGYRHWLGLTMGRPNAQPRAATTVAHYHAKVRRPQTRLWCFGFDMNNMKARCWYDSTLPVHTVPTEMHNTFIGHVHLMIDVAADAAFVLHRNVKAAWFKVPGDAAPEPAIPQSFWEASEPEFYRCIDALAQCDLEDNGQVAAVILRWLRAVRAVAMSRFEHWTQRGPVEDRNLKRVVGAQVQLSKDLNNGKAAKEAWTFVNSQNKEAA